MSDRPKVVITDFDYGDNDIEKAIIEAAGGRVVGLQAKSEEDLFEHAEDCFAMINQYARVGAKTIARMKKCKVIARYGVGVDIVDVKTATERRIMVTNVQDYCTDEVADHAISLWLTLVRKLLQFNESTHSGVWSWHAARPVYRLRGRVMGIVSLGKIGQAIAERARAFGVRIIAYDPYLDPAVAADIGVELVDKQTLVAQSNYILMQAPMTPETRHFLSDAEFAAMQPGAILVNTGRGPTVDNAALYRALTEGTLAGAGLDDPEEEPAKRAHWDPADNPIFTLPNVIVTPHTAYYSEESIEQARQTAASEVARVLRGERPKNLLNTDVLD
ncbi:C-terminal binding protein [Tropicimonas marinistellae]|uniref:C-terminal binding protein n=1 Tax=Tropicimonas marinistellae TaxID=1739787 RepID=UPI000831A63D|nr:C-terminal binding protein [Tropicimonas marinistellae]